MTRDDLDGCAPACISCVLYLTVFLGMVALAVKVAKWVWAS